MIFFYLLVGVMPLTQHRIWSRHVGEITVFKYLGAACLLYAIWHIATRRTIGGAYRTWQASAFVAFYFLGMLSYARTGDRLSADVSPFLSYTSFLILLFITSALVNSLRRLRFVLLTAVGSVAFASLYVLREWQQYRNMYVGFRPGWVVGDPNYFTVSALACLPVAFYLAIERRGQLERAFYFGCLVLTLAAVTVAASRGGFLGIIAALLVVSLHSRQRIRNLSIAAVLVIPLSIASPMSPLKRLMHPSPSDQGAADIRTAVWKAGLQMIRQHPLAGVGLGNYKPEVHKYGKVDDDLKNIAHNSYIEIAAEMGLPALFLFLAILYSSVRNLEQVRRRALRLGLPFLHQAAAGLQAGLVGCSVALFFVSGQYQKLFWLLIFLSMCLPSLLESASRRRKEATERGEVDSLHSSGAVVSPAPTKSFVWS